MTRAWSGPCSSATTGARWWCGTPRCCTLTGSARPPGSACHRYPGPGLARPKDGGRSSARTSTCCASRSPASPTPRWPPTWPSQCVGCSPGCSGDAPLPDWISPDEFEHYVTEFGRTGFTGALNWYRNYDRNWETTPHLAGAQTTVPALFVGGTADPVGPTMNPARAREVVAGRTPRRGSRVPGTGFSRSGPRRSTESCWRSCAKWRPASRTILVPP